MRGPTSDRASLVLASASPRRRLLLTAAGVSIAAVRPSDVPEDRAPGEAPVAFARRIALDKARAVPAPGCWVLSADTIVHVGGDLFQKPCDDDDATRILSALAGRWHTVTTAWCLRWGGGPPPAGRRQLRGAVHSRVRFRALTAAEIATYVASGEGRDKAGSYGIQERGVMLIDRVVGSFTNVVGLPMVQVMSALCQVGIDPEAP